MKQTLAIYAALLALVLAVVGIVVWTGGVDLPEVLPPAGETQIKVFAANNDRIVQVGEIECDMAGDCESLGVRGFPGITAAEARSVEPNVRLVFDASSGNVAVRPLR
jgi:hypothetical protein